MKRRAFRAAGICLSAAAIVAAACLCAAEPNPKDTFGPEREPMPLPVDELDLKTCYELAVLRSETVGMKDEEIRAAEARYWQAIGTVLPKVHSVTEEHAYNSGNEPFNLTERNRTDSFKTKLQVRVPILNGLRDVNLIGAGSAEKLQRRHDRQRVLELLYLDVAEAYYQLLGYERDMAILLEIGGTLQERVTDLERRVKLGKSRASELLAAQTDLAQARVVIEQTRGLLSASREMLAFLTGLDARQVRLKDAPGRVPRAATLESYLRTSGERADILSAVQAERSARLQVAAARGEHWPTVALEGSYVVAEDPPSREEWDAFITIDVPLFEGGLIEAKVREQKARFRQSQLNLSQLRRATGRDVRTAYTRFISSVAEVLSLKEAARTAAANYAVQKKDYELGVVTNQDVLLSLRQLQDIRRQLADAELGAELDLIRLHVAAGEAAP